MENKSNLTFTFDGDYEVDALSVVTAVQGLIKISNEIAKQNYPDIEFRLAVRALAPGSLSFDFVALANVAQTLFTPGNVQYAKNLIDCVKTSFEIKRFLKGKPPKSKRAGNESIIIENTDGSKMSIPTQNGVYFINPVIDQSITGIFAESSMGQGVSGIKLIHGRSVVEIPAEEFGVLSSGIDIEELPKDSENKRITINRASEILFIRKPDLLGNAKWEFKSDKYITADIEDRDFLSTIQSGAQSISAKMYIIADLRVAMELGADGVPDENTCKYTITKVHSIHAPGEDQIGIEE